MGALAQNFGFTGAPQAASAGLQWGSASVGLSSLAPVLSGIGGFQQSMFQAQVAANNARIAQQNAGAAIQAGQYEESASKLRTGLAIGQERAAQGANNVDVNVGSPVATRATTAQVGAMDAAMIHYNAAREAYGYRVEASSQAAQSQLERMAAGGKLTEGLFGGATTFLSGASSLAGKAAQLRLAFPSGGSVSNSSATGV